MQQGIHAAFVYSDGFTEYDFGPDHPLRPERLRLTYEQIDAQGMFGRPEVCLVAAQPAAEAEVLAVHTRAYYDAVAALSSGRRVANAGEFGFGILDNRPFPGMLEASLLYTGASLQAARLVSSGQAPRAMNIAGGLHHAMPGRASGFCIFNDPAVAIADLLQRHERVLYVDIDAHHGDGVQAIFYDSPRVLTVSLHESGRTLFPGTGTPDEIGVGAGVGYSVNAPLMAGTGDAAFLRVFEALLPPLVEWFQPEVVVAQLGVDTHYADPLAHLSLTTDGFLRMVRAMRDWGKPLVALGGGGYDPDVVAHAWTLAFACLAEIDLPDRPGQAGPFPDEPPVRPRLYGDPAAAEAFADRTIEAVRRRVFARHGI